MRLLAVVVALGAVGSWAKLPACGVERCLVDGGRFAGCEPSDLVCLCDLEQGLVEAYVEAVEPCLESAERKYYCTEGAYVQYKELLVGVCRQFGKDVVF